ncbi:MAG: hypothetical protein J5I93_16310, partial [Pirellulaceae bacterium]|nr:hypothetical protein [Pirellulaceae bacterium]
APGAGAAPGALACLLGGLLWAAWRNVRPPLADRRDRDRVWLDFRDQFGAFWALRVAERMNVALAQQRWPLVLGWSGFSRSEHSAGEGDLSPATPAAVDATLHSLLRRFVSRDWIAARTEPAAGNGEDPRDNVLE